VGIQTDYFVATDEEMARLALRDGVINPQLDTPLCAQVDGQFVLRRADGSLRAVEGRPVRSDDTAVLEELLLGRAPAFAQLVRDFRGMVDVHEEAGEDVDPDDIDPEDDVWIFRYSDGLRTALAGVRDEDCAAIAARWSELARASGRSNAAEGCHEWLLPRLVELCRNARAGDALFAWESL
jgi:hypothetical protein